MRSLRSSLMEFDPRRRRQARTSEASKLNKSRPRPDDPVLSLMSNTPSAPPAAATSSPRKSKSLHSRTLANNNSKNSSKEDPKSPGTDRVHQHPESPRSRRRTSGPAPTIRTRHRGRSRIKVTVPQSGRSKSTTVASPRGAPTTSTTTTATTTTTTPAKSRRGKSSSAATSHTTTTTDRPHQKKRRSRSTTTNHYNSCYRGGHEDRLHLVLARRTQPEMLALLDELQSTARDEMETDSLSTPITSVCVYADSPLFCSHRHRCHYSPVQTRMLLQQVGLSLGRHLQQLQLDFSRDFGSSLHSISNNNNSGLPLLSTTLPVNIPTGNHDPPLLEPPTNTGDDPGGAGRCILECEVLAGILRHAPHLESLSLKEVVLDGDVQELRDALLHPMATTATPYSTKSHLRHIAFQWCTGPDPARTLEILTTLTTTVAEMPHLSSLVWWVSDSYQLHRVVPKLARSPSLTKLTLGLEQRIPYHPTTPLGSNVTTTDEETTQDSSKEQRTQEQLMILALLEGYGSPHDDVGEDGTLISPLQELRICSHHWTQEMAPRYIQALANMLKRNVTGGGCPSLKSLVWIDYHCGTLHCPEPEKDRGGTGTNGISLLPLLASLRGNPESCLGHLQIVTKQRLGSLASNPLQLHEKKHRAQANTVFAQALKDCLEKHSFLESVEVVHAGVSMNFPGLKTKTALPGADVSFERRRAAAMGSWNTQGNEYQGFRRSRICSSIYRGSHSDRPCKECGDVLHSNPTFCKSEKHIFHYNRTMIAFLLMTNQLHARQRLWLTSSSEAFRNDNESIIKTGNDNNGNVDRTKQKKTDTAFDSSTWVSFLGNHRDNTPLLFFLLRQNPTAIVSAVSTSSVVVAASAAADRLAYAKLRSQNAGRRRRLGLRKGHYAAKGGEPIWESYF